MDGGDLTGTLQPWMATCFPGLDELDLSFNEVSLACREALQLQCGRCHACRMGAYCNKLQAGRFGTSAIWCQKHCLCLNRHASSSGNLNITWFHVSLQLTGTLPAWLGTMNVTQLEVEENKVEAPFYQLA